jgi:hypothetical protein
MYVLIMIVLLSNSSANLSHLYYENESACYDAAREFESHRSKDVKLKAFCIRGE